MSPRGRPNRALAIALALLLVLGLATEIGATRPAGAEVIRDVGGNSIAVTGTSSFSFSPSTFEQLATNTSISVAFTDAASVAHTFTIIGREGYVIPSGISETDFNNLVFGHSPTVVYNINASGPGTVSGNFTAPGPGWYEFVCTEPGHFQSGMYGFIAFGENLPSNLTVAAAAQGPGAALFIIIGTIVSLVVIALVLGFVVGRRKGSMHEMPPERLGYAEPPGPGEPLPPSSDEGPHS
jgi:plastocyanin